MKRANLIAVAAVVGIIFIAGSIYAGGHKYRRTPYQPPESGETYSSESVTSMSDCMEFSANHKSKGVAADKDEFKGQFGNPIKTQGNVATYSYDKYTNVMLDCQARKCSCRCLTKY